MYARDAIEAAREGLNLPMDAFAALLGVAPDAVQGDGDDAVAAALADVFGLELFELDAPSLLQRPTTAMLRSFIDEGAGAFEEMVAQGLPSELGRFTRLVRRKARLRSLLGHATTPPRLEGRSSPIGAEERVPFRAEALAESVRARLGRGDEPIASMLALMRGDVGAEVHFSASLWSRVEGASVFAGATRAVLINVRDGRGGMWWRTRTTLAHELCHLLFDVAVFRGNRATLIFSPSAERRAAGEGYAPRFAARHDVFRRVEQRANAFAAYFLAPRGGVQQLFGGREPPQTPASVFAVASRFGVSPVTAANHLTNLYGWSFEHRGDLLTWVDEVANEWSPPLEHPDLIADVPPVDPELRGLVAEAVARGVLPAAMGARWLGDAPAGDGSAPAVEGAQPVGHWARRTHAEAADSILEHLSAGKVDAALTVLWDAFHDWQDANDVDKCRALVAALPPASVDGNVVVSVVALLRGAPSLADERRVYERAARAALGDERALALLGPERAVDP